MGTNGTNSEKILDARGAGGLRNALGRVGYNIGPLFVLPDRYPSATIACERVPLRVVSKALTGPTDLPGRSSPRDRDRFARRMAAL